MRKSVILNDENTAKVDNGELSVKDSVVRMILVILMSIELIKFSFWIITL